MNTNSRLLQAVISVAGDRKFYRLPPDKENPEFTSQILILSKPIEICPMLFLHKNHAAN